MKRVSELYDVISVGIESQRGAPKNVYSRFGQSSELRCGTSVGTDKKLINIQRRNISHTLNTNTALLNIRFLVFCLFCFLSGSSS